MSVQKAYNSWAESYDEMLNKTRDLEEKVIRETLDGYYKSVVELGCGTGKNTAWLLQKCESLIAMDFSEAMLLKAQEKIESKKVSFKQQDLNIDWGLPEDSVDLVSCSLVLEHIKDLDAVFAKASKILKTDGQFYISELHPFKQYSGSKARFDDGNGIQELEVYVHHITDYTEAAAKNGFKLVQLKEWFDDDNKENIPRLVSFLFQK
ncbi:class I SAM-dependent DNA methyltransferase [Gillisia marina]|uniref:class I SAM-dependent DNA methyltransferase n=1 Tax=Gillisia marina TaxID=1167637 RepID=UPI00029B2491|nr:class I SAM-dependent methyltransferase [Gillisia marina]